MFLSHGHHHGSQFDFKRFLRDCCNKKIILETIVSAFTQVGAFSFSTLEMLPLFEKACTFNKRALLVII